MYWPNLNQFFSVNVSDSNLGSKTSLPSGQSFIFSLENRKNILISEVYSLKGPSVQQKWSHF